MKKMLDKPYKTHTHHKLRFLNVYLLLEITVLIIAMIAVWVNPSTNDTNQEPNSQIISAVETKKGE